ncbi:DeoR/GlpR family DNA-binding transcription regulator [Halanaerobium salsuginis]|jgi:DeoR family fructose operon transcriptional repressor|uniref:Transcriptional regulator, DeoR family n=1 Tax=Halanaerobium salsuginis TaxID=29563 RepID=A0A1I4MSF4_9FIRM|nr:DeoR/GlpR family DNA-binding transcription regulator [Halanaerobium salsuginis]SFM06010.1 transcriptional regulator, DeoR family [Halanaerobium salsuginis]
MFAEERRKNIIYLLEKEKRVSVNELSGEFDVSRATIRRDLSELESDGFLRRTHGGAILRSSSKLELTFKEKEDKFFSEKKAIGKKAAELIKDGDSIFLDAGTTTRHIIDNLKGKKKLTIVTHALHIINKINEIKLDCELVVIGGNFKWSTEAMVGPIAEDILKKLRIDKSFIGTNGFKLDSFATTPELGEAKIKEIALEISSENFLLFDRSKWKQVYFYKFADFNLINYIITDQIEEKREAALNERGIEVIIA